MSNWSLNFFDHCATSTMLTLPFFMLESWNFHPCLLFFKTQCQRFLKSNYGIFLPLCNTKNANFAIFDGRVLEFSPDSLSTLNESTMAKICEIRFWPFWPRASQKIITCQMWLIRYHCAVPTASLSLQKPQAWTPIVDFTLLPGLGLTFLKVS